MRSHTKHCALVAATILVACAAEPPSPDGCGVELMGTYEAVSESEWTLSLALLADGAAEVVHSSWIVGQSEDAVEEVSIASWSCSGNKVMVSMGDQRVVFEASDALSFADFGAAGSGRGLRSAESSPEGLFRGVSLWRSEDLRTIPEIH